MDKQRLLKEIAANAKSIAAASGHRINEQNTRETLITPILAALGWDTRNCEEVYREYKPMKASNPVDYALMIRQDPVLLLEAKGLGEAMDDIRWIDQMVAYAAVSDVKWCVLTDGDTWQFVNAKAPGSTMSRIFMTTKISADSHESVAKTLSCIARENMLSDSLDNLWRSAVADKEVKRTLLDLIENTDARLVSLIAKGTPSIKRKDVAESLSRLSISVSIADVPIDKESKPTRHLSRKTPKKLRSVPVGERVILTLETPWTSTRPLTVTFPGSSTAEETNGSWKGVFVTVCQWIAKKHKKQWDHFIKTRGKMKFFTTNPKLLREPKEVNNGVYAETHASAERFRQNICKICKSCNIRFFVPL